jgi:hypothetical protein
MSNTSNELEEYLAAILESPDEYLHEGADFQKYATDTLSKLITLNNLSLEDRNEILAKLKYKVAGVKVHPVQLNVQPDNSFQILQAIYMCVYTAEKYNAVRYTEHCKLLGERYYIRDTACKQAIEGVALNFLKKGDVDSVSLCVDASNEADMHLYLPGMFRKFTAHVPLVTVERPAPGLISFGKVPVHLDPLQRYSVLVRYNATFNVSVDNLLTVPMQYIGLKCLAYSEELLK